MENDKINYSVQFDEEPTIRWLRLYKDKIFVDEKQIQGSILEMAKQIVEDIEFNIKSWAFFYYDYCQNSPEQYEAKTPKYVARLSA